METIEMQRFEPTVDSLLDYECPAWFKEAKFGIYVHWGVYSVAEHGEWIGRMMYEEGTQPYKYMCERYGHPSQFGYKDLVPLWKAEKFDPDRRYIERWVADVDTPAYPSPIVDHAAEREVALADFRRGRAGGPG